MFRAVRRFSNLSYTSKLYETLVKEEPEFLQLEKFLNFVNQMSKLEQVQHEEESRVLVRDHQFKLAALTGKEPLRDILSTFINNRKDFNGEDLAACLEWLEKAARARGDHFYTDFTKQQLFSSWQFEVIVNDLESAVEGYEQMAPLHIARCIEALSKLGYKNAELYKNLTEILSNPPEPKSSPGHKYHVYSGFVNNEEFQNHIKTLLAWKTPQKVSGNTQIEKEFKQLVETSHSNKLVQKALASGITNLNRAYWELVERQQQEEVLDTPEIIEGIAELQEALVRARMLNPNDLESSENFTDFNKLMQRSEATFNRLVNSSYPYFKSPIIDAIYEATKPYHKLEMPDYSKIEIPTSKTIEGEISARVIYGLAECMNIPVAEVNGKEYPNPAWPRKTKKHHSKLGEDNYLKLALPFTNTWKQNKELVLEHNHKLEKVLEHCELAVVGLGLEGLGKASVVNKSIVDKLPSLFEQGKKHDIEGLVSGLYGVGLMGYNQKVADLFLQEIVNHPELETLSVSSLLKALWGQCVFGVTNESNAKVLIDRLDNFKIEYCSEEEVELLKDIGLALETQFKDKPEYQSSALKEGVSYARSRSLCKEKLYDPVKDLMKTLTRNFIGFGLTKEETEDFFEQISKTTEVFDDWDDLLGFKGKPLAVYILGDEGFCGNQIVGKYKLKARNLESLGFKVLFVPYNDFVELDSSEPNIKLKENLPFESLVKSQLGSIPQHLEKMDNFTNKWLQSFLKNKKSFSVQHRELAQALLGAYKFQVESRIKISQPEYNSALQKIKIELFKALQVFKGLSEQQKTKIENIVKESSEFPSFEELLKSTNKGIPVTQTETPSWGGMRQAMEHKNHTFTIDQELINHEFLWVEDYFNYKDWEKKVVKELPLAVDCYMNADPFYNNFFTMGRRQQYGILPDPSKASSLGNKLSGETKLMCSLLNIKYNLKRQFSDQEILDKVLGMQTLDQLYEEHTSEKQPVKRLSLPRDSNSLVELHTKQKNLSRMTDPFSNYYRKHFAVQNAKDSLFKRLIKSKEAISEHPGLSQIDKHGLKNRLTEKYMKTAQEIDKNNPNREILFRDFRTHTYELEFDPETLQVKPYKITKDPEYLSFDSDQNYLEFKMRKAETSLLKARIIYKLALEKELTQNEKNYLQKWKAALDSSSIRNAGKVLVQKKVTSMTFESLDTADKDFLNSLPKVELSSETKEYCLNELFFELSHFIDEETIKEIESAYIEKRILSDWGIQSEDVSLVEGTRNKSKLIQNLEEEEKLWREQGRFDSEDTNRFKSIWGVMRGKSYKDRIYWDLDTKSFDEFLEDTNDYDSRLKFIKHWYQRKQEEIRERTKIPRGKFAKSDRELRSKWLEAKTTQAKSKLETHLDMPWEEITPKALSFLLKELKVKLGNNKFAEKDKELMNCLLLHPNLTELDSIEIDTLKTYYKFQEDEIDNYIFADPVKVRGDKITEVKSQGKKISSLSNILS